MTNKKYRLWHVKLIISHGLNGKRWEEVFFSYYLLFNLKYSFNLYKWSIGELLGVSLGSKYVQHS